MRILLVEPDLGTVIQRVLNEIHCGLNLVRRQWPGSKNTQWGSTYTRQLSIDVARTFWYRVVQAARVQNNPF